MQFQMLFQELIYSSQIIAALLEGISPEESRFKPHEHTWSILEVVCHLLDEEREDFREHLDFILHHQSDATWDSIDPQGWVLQRKYNQRDFEATRQDLSLERGRSLEWLQGLENADWFTTYVSEFGRMSAGDMLASWVAHDNLHIRQLVELRRLFIERITTPFHIEYAGDW